MENKRKNSGEEAEKLRNALQEAVDKAKNANKEVCTLQYVVCSIVSLLIRSELLAFQTLYLVCILLLPTVPPSFILNLLIH